jgi:hypothetical protein
MQFKTCETNFTMKPHIRLIISSDLKYTCVYHGPFFGLAYQGKDIVFRFIIEYSSLRDFGPYVIGLFLYEDF